MYNTTNKLNSLKVLYIYLIYFFIKQNKALNSNGISTHKAGFRINNQKYYTVNFDAESGTWFLKKNQGGACIAKTKSAVVVGTFST